MAKAKVTATVNTDSENDSDQIYIESWYQRSWRPLMAGLYLLLCLLDYGIRPVVNFQMLRRFNLVETVSVIKDLDSTVQVQIIEVLRNSEAVPPILTEFVHISFGAILGVAAYSRTMEKIDRDRNSGGTPTVVSPSAVIKPEDEDETGGLVAEVVDESDTGPVG